MLTTNMLTAAIQGLGGRQLQHLGGTAAKAILALGLGVNSITSADTQKVLQKLQRFFGTHGAAPGSHTWGQKCAGTILAQPFIRGLVIHHRYHVNNSRFFMTILT